MRFGVVQSWNLGEQIVIFKNENQNNNHEILDDRTYLILKKDMELELLSNETIEIVDGSCIHLDEIQHGDILTISEEGKIRKVHSEYQREIDIFVTNKCNSNCIMCPLSENSRKREDRGHLTWIQKYIQALPKNVDYINITGGEPTLLKENFFKIMYQLRDKFQYSEFQLLTNGRSAADRHFCEQMLACMPYGILIAIPVHASKVEIHDEITQVSGSFRQTDRGIKNLLMYQQRIEIRIVLSRKNIDYMEETANYITENYKGIYSVTFMAMEMMGSAAVHRSELWVDYKEVFRKIKKAIDILVYAGMDVKLYNFPLCVVNRGYWHIAAKSITDYKIRYMNECDNCRVKDICGGFFYSTKQLMKPQVEPIG